MKITDKQVLKELKRVRSCELEMSLETYPEDEREGRTDAQVVADELSYILSCFDEDGHVLCDDLEESRRILKETKNGKVIPLWTQTLTPMYSKSRIESCRDCINEYNRLKNYMKRLNAQGIRGYWQ